MRPRFDTPSGVPGVPVAGADGRPKPKSMGGDQWRGRYGGGLSRRRRPAGWSVEGGERARRRTLEVPGRGGQNLSR